MREEKRLKNSRIIPTTKKIWEDKKLSIGIYTKLQIESRYNDMDIHRYIYDDEINVTQWSKELKLSRPTFNKGLKYLIDTGIIRRFEIDGRKGYKICNKFEKFLLFDREFLNALLNIGSNNLIKVYFVYYKYSMVYGICRLTQAKLLQEIGYSSVSENNKVMLKNINLALDKLGLIDIQRTAKRERGKTKTLLEITAPIYYETSYYKSIKENKN